VLRLDTSEGEQLYAVGFGSCGDWRFAWRCDKPGFSFVPGLAFSNHLQFGQGCMAANIVLTDERGKVLSDPGPGRTRNLRIETRAVEFIADDGRLVRAEW
jgi:hypothetical protein